ncbi:MAG: thioredoxin domain-containing protein [Candidatus Micrarchaeota archaeon]
MENDYVIAISIVASALILSGVIWVSAGGISNSVTNLQASLANLQPAQTGSGQQLQPSPTETPQAATILSAEQVQALYAKAAGKKGEENANVTILEFSDYQCPYCRRHYNTAYQQIESDYVEKGKTKIAFMDFTLSFHPAAIPAANAMRCAGEQGKYWEAHDAVFEAQTPLGQGTIEFGVEEIKKWIGNVTGIDKTKLNACIDSNKYASAIEESLNLGAQVGIGGTPGFIINGVVFAGACPYQTFQQAIDAAAEGKKFSVDEKCAVQVTA